MSYNLFAPILPNWDQSRKKNIYIQTTVSCFMVDTLWGMLLTLGLWQAHNVLQDLVNDWPKAGLNVLPELRQELYATNTLNQLCRSPVLQHGIITAILSLLLLDK